jgi:hypothetical protein
MWVAMIVFLLLFAIGNSAAVVLADVDDDPVTTRAEFKMVESASELIRKEVKFFKQTSGYAVAVPVDSEVAIGRVAFSPAPAFAQTSLAASSSPLRC